MMQASWRRLLGPGLMTLVMMAVLIGLGTWQVYRLHWKEGILAQIAQAEASPPVPLTPDPAPFTKVSASGQFRFDQAVWYGDDVRTIGSGPRMGFFQIVPLERQGAPTVLVNRGWIPDAAGVPVVRPTGPATVQGYILPSQSGSWLAAANDVPNRHFYKLDVPAIAAALHLTDVAPYVLVALGPDNGAYPAPAEHLPQPPNNHLSYVITWYGLAAALLAIFIAWARKAPAPSRPA